MFVELAYGVITNSLGLISDSAHMFFDCSALVLSLLASYFATFPANERFSFGYGRIEIVSGLTNCIFLIFVAFSITMESIERLIKPQAINSDKLLVVAILGLLVNLVGVAFFHDHDHEHHHHHSEGEEEGGSHNGRGQHHHNHAPTEKDNASVSSESPTKEDLGKVPSQPESLPLKEILDSDITVCGRKPEETKKVADTVVISNMPAPTEAEEESHRHHANENMSGVYLHILADALGSVGVIVSALLIKYFDMLISDAVCSLVISGLILASIVALFKTTVSVLILHLPVNMIQQAEAISTEILSMNKVSECTELKMWRYRSHELVAVIQVEVDRVCDKRPMLEQLRKLMKTMGITYYTIEINAIDEVSEN